MVHTFSPGQGCTKGEARLTVVIMAVVASASRDG